MMHTTSVGPEVYFIPLPQTSSSAPGLGPRCTRHWSTKYNDSLRGRVSDLSGALSVSPTLHLSAIVWLRGKVTLLLQEHSPRTAQKVAVISAGLKMRRRILGQTSSGLGMTAASMTAKPTNFQLRRPLEVPA